MTVVLLSGPPPEPPEPPEPAESPPPAPATLAAPAPLRPAVLPGSRWRQRPSSGHGTQTCAVIRVGQHSITFVMEGGGRGGGSHKSGRKFTVPAAAFFTNHTLLSQPAGYQAGDEHLPDVPKTDTLQSYFRRRALVRRFTTLVDGTDVRDSVSDLLPRGPGAVPWAVTAADGAPPFPPLHPPPRPAVAGATPAEETLVSTPHAARSESVANPVIPLEYAAQAQQLVAPADAPESAPGPVAPAESPAEPPAEPAEPLDPIEQFMESGRVLVDGLNARIAGALGAIDALKREADALQERRIAAREAYDRLVGQKDRIEAAVLAAISATGEPPAPPAPSTPPTVSPERSEPPPPTEPTVRVVSPEELRTVTSVAGSTRLMGPGGFAADPAKGSQRDWVLDRFARDQRLAIQDVVDEFAAHFGMTRERAIKAVSSTMGRQVQKPNPLWPRPVRMGLGSYQVAQTTEDAEHPSDAQDAGAQP